MLDDRLDPRHCRGRVERFGAPQEYLDAALIGVVGVVGAQRVAARDREQRLRVLGDDRDDDLLSRSRNGLPRRQARDRLTLLMHAGNALHDVRGLCARVHNNARRTNRNLSPAAIAAVLRKPAYSGMSAR